MEWTEEQEEFLSQNYPKMGKSWCCNQMGLKEYQIRYKASAMGLRLDRDSDVIKTAIKKRIKTITGRKRPDQAEVMRNLWKIGKIVSPPKKERICSVCGKPFYSKNSKNHRKTCSDECLHKFFETQWKIKEHPKGMLGKKHTKEACKIMSKTRKENWNNMPTDEKQERLDNMIIGKLKKYGTLSLNKRESCSWQAGWREIGGKKKYFRSKWEANYARYLEFLKQHKEIAEWQHEPKTFWFEKIKRGCRSYLPDFEIINNDGSIEYHEVKGWYDERSQTKIKRMKKYYPNVKLKVIFEKEYKSIARSLSGLIKEWE